LREARILHSDLEELNKELDEVLFVLRSLVIEQGTLQFVHCRDLLNFKSLER
jgi:hypothetical protein